MDKSVLTTDSFWVALAFGIFVSSCFYFGLWGKFMKFLDSHREKIRTSMEEAKSTHDEMIKKHELLESELEKAKQDAQISMAQSKQSIKELIKNKEQEYQERSKRQKLLMESKMKQLRAEVIRKAQKEICIQVMSELKSNFEKKKVPLKRSVQDLDKLKSLR